VGKIRIQFIIGQLTLGGSERHMADVAMSLDRNLFQPQVLCLRRGGPLQTHLRAAGVECLEAPVVTGMLTFNWQVRRAVERFRPDVVCVYTYIDKLWGRLAAMMAKTPVILSSSRSIKWPWYERLLLPSTTAVVANSRMVQELFRARYNLPPEKVLYLPNGVDLTRFQPPCCNGDPEVALRLRNETRARFGLDLDAELTAQVARFNEVKDHAASLSAFRLVKNARPAAQLVLVGHGPLEEDIRAKVRRLGLSDSVIFLPAETSVAQVFHCADMVVLSSQSESLPRTLVEAAACGRPVVATNVGGCNEVVLDGRTGLLAIPGNAQDLAQKWIRLLESAELRARMGAAARTYALETYSLEAMTKQFQELVQRLVEAKTGRSASAA
jgi:glycosyltransferase involved in cell wall biosynthesis